MPEATNADFELARAALLEITPESTIGEPAGSIDEGDGVISVYFSNTMPGYPGWRWTVSIAHVEGCDPSVLEAELTPGDDALLSPAWVPWADRLAEYKAQQAEAEASELDDAALDGADHDDDDDDDDFDDDDLDDDLLHADDLDGVDIDSLEDHTDDSDDESGDESGDDSDDASAPEAQVEQSDQAESDADGGGDEQPKAVGRRKRRADDQHEG